MLGVPVSSDKLEGPATILPFLGILLDTSALEVCLQDEAEEILHEGPVTILPFLGILLDTSALEVCLQDEAEEILHETVVKQAVQNTYKCCRFRK